MYIIDYGLGWVHWVWRDPNHIRPMHLGSSPFEPESFLNFEHIMFFGVSWVGLDWVVGLDEFIYSPKLHPNFSLFTFETKTQTYVSNKNSQIYLYIAKRIIS